jgi:hypothetical protein
MPKLLPSRLKSLNYGLGGFLVLLPAMVLAYKAFF